MSIIKMFMYSSYRIVKRAATATTHTHGARVEADALAHKTRQHIPYAECALHTHEYDIWHGWAACMPIINMRDVHLSQRFHINLWSRCDGSDVLHYTSKKRREVNEKNVRR